jgi:excisionase family DNA binding protein
MRLLTIDEVSGLLRVRRARAYQLLRSGLLPVVRIGRQIRVEEDALRDWVDRGGRALEPRHELKHNP